MMVIWCLIAWMVLSGILLYALCKASAIADEAARWLYDNKIVYDKKNE